MDCGRLSPLEQRVQVVGHGSRLYFDPRLRSIPEIYSIGDFVDSMMMTAFAGSFIFSFSSSCCFDHWYC